MVPPVQSIQRAVVCTTLLLLAALLVPSIARAEGLHRIPLQPGEILPQGMDYDPAIPSPLQILGFEVGERHVYPHELVQYYEAVAAASPRVSLEYQGRRDDDPREGFSHEGRPLIVAVVTAPGRHDNLETVRRAHQVAGTGIDSVTGTDGDSAEVTGSENHGDAPVVVWLGYSIHGNEASGSNAALLVLYHLAAARGGEVEDWLDNAVVLLDPSLNPDGLARFAQWVNSHRGRQPVGDRWHREHREPWPGGRTNHYLYDLNRDWLLLQHPESRARVRTLRRWRPHLLGDFHEMGSDATYFFQPGIPSRKNPLIPDENVEITGRIARHHADALDALGSLYYTQESFDDFYPGKGSTYPDLTGAVGVLFEQASARGHLRDDIDDGPLTFAFAVRNQFTTSLSMVRGAVAEGDALRGYRGRFYQRGQQLAAEDAAAGWLFAFPGDRSRARRMLSILLTHGIEVREMRSPTTVDGEEIDARELYWVPAGQPEYHLAKALFERRTAFEDSTFYDISAWTLPLAFGARWEEITGQRLGALEIGDAMRELPPLAGRTPTPESLTPRQDAVAWAFSWSPHDAPRALQRLLAAGARVRVASSPFDADTDDGRRTFHRGTVVVPRGLQGQTLLDRLPSLLQRMAQDDGVAIFALTSGLTPNGVDLGSASLRTVPAVRPALLVGNSISSYGTGELWHLLDLHYGVPTTLLQQSDVARADLGDYTHLLMVQGSYDNLGDQAVASLRRFMKRGGTIVALRDAATWAQQHLDGEMGADRVTTAPPEGRQVEPMVQRPDRPTARAEGVDGAAEEPPPTSPLRPYDTYRQDIALDLVSGSLFEAHLDLSHPLAYGYDRPRLPLFRSGTRVLEPSPSPYETPSVYTADPLLAGYASAENVTRIAGTPALVARKVGDGQLLLFADAPSFRGFWLGTQRLLANALFFGPTLRSTDGPSRD